MNGGRTSPPFRKFLLAFGRLALDLLVVFDAEIGHCLPGSGVWPDRDSEFPVFSCAAPREGRHGSPPLGIDPDLLCYFVQRRVLDDPAAQR